MLHVEGRDGLIGQLVTLSVIDVRAKDDFLPRAHTSSAPDAYLYLRTYRDKPQSILQRHGVLQDSEYHLLVAIAR